MFVKTVKMGTVVRTLGIILIVMIIILGAVYLFNRSTGGGALLDSEESRAEFLESLGWRISPEPLDVRQVVIPSDWNEVYEEYNRLQLQQGLDLNGYRGKGAEIYTYEIYNYQDGRQNVVANLVICEGRLIAGDVCCTELGGFMHGLLPPKEGELTFEDEAG